MTTTLSTLVERADLAEKLLQKLRADLAEIIAAKQAVIDDVTISEKDALTKVGELGARESLILRQIQRAEAAFKAASAASMNEANFLGRRVSKLVQDRIKSILVRLDKALQPFYPEEERRLRVVDVLRQHHLPPEVYEAQQLVYVSPGPSSVRDIGPLGYAKATLLGATTAITTLNLK